MQTARIVDDMDIPFQNVIGKPLEVCSQVDQEERKIPANCFERVEML